ncbi:DUF397 domain-containing protein [Actinosynnema sp. ALI-1.44]|uniref:DUF397 domain-containing protein n=1 Tax=Actinosynnema sp. ALI-1.44 TaxID=1933779 RepID=UPI00097BD5D0|nr:DUF397 domain-containing protein [Actinosynnema sp. ALI-1.44]ONI90576.1 DUF397 domain-containing protein [Actinosynnema sp. ALI-1.44]
MRTWHSVLSGWRTSSYSHYEENACVDVGAGYGLVGVRDTKQTALEVRARPVLVFVRPAFTVFLDRLKVGDTGVR